MARPPLSTLERSYRDDVLKLMHLQPEVECWLLSAVNRARAPLPPLTREAFWIAMEAMLRERTPPGESLGCDVSTEVGRTLVLPVVLATVSGLLAQQYPDSFLGGSIH